MELSPHFSPPQLKKTARYKKIVFAGSKADDFFVDVFIRSYDKTPPRIIIDLDATDDPVHGNQLGGFFHGYYGGYCYLPLYIFCGEHLLCARLRPSDIDASDGSLKEIIRIVGQLRVKAQPKKYGTCSRQVRYHPPQIAQDWSTDKSDGAKGVGIAIAELAVSSDFCDGVPAVAESASGVAAVLTKIAGSIQVENEKFLGDNGDSTAVNGAKLRLLTCAQSTSGLKTHCWRAVTFYRVQPCPNPAAGIAPPTKIAVKLHLVRNAG